LPNIAAISIHNVDFIATIAPRIKHNLLPIWRPGGRNIAYLIIRKLDNIFAVGIHHINLAIAVTIRIKCNLSE
jgi:hypothetical protein